VFLHTLCVFRFPLVWLWCISASHNTRTGRPCRPQWREEHWSSSPRS